MFSIIKYLREDIESSEKNIEISEDQKNLARCAIAKLFTEHPNPDDSDVHALADKLQIDPHEFEEVIYKLLTGFLKGVGKHKEVPIDKFNPEEIKMGIEVEQEHTDSKAIALQIAKDHLSEIPDYYTRLKKMEDQAKKSLW
jgi:hypothetical protein